MEKVNASRDTKFTVVILMYNNDLQTVLLTLKSVLFQDFEDFDIVFADDGSSKQWKQEIEEYLLEYGFFRYCFAPSDVNVGTVKNMIRALDYAHGEYVKCIGAGDYLIDETVLTEVYHNMKNMNVRWSFGEMSGYCISERHIKNKRFVAPIEIWPYKKKCIDKIKERAIVFGDHISGAAMFFEREHLMQLLNQIKEYVIYTEDLLQIIEFLEDEMVLFIPKKLIGYEVGTGISTSGKVSERLINDFNQFEKYLNQEYNNNSFVERRNKRNIILKNKIKIIKYSFLICESPKRLFYEVYNRKINIKRREYLGFLERKEYYSEFELERV